MPPTNPEIRVVLLMGSSLCLHINCVLFLCTQRLLVETVCLNLMVTCCLLISPQPNIFHFHHICRISDTFVYLAFNPYKKPYLREVESRPWETESVRKPGVCSEPKQERHDSNSGCSASKSDAIPYPTPPCLVLCGSGCLCSL